MRHSPVNFWGIVKKGSIGGLCLGLVLTLLMCLIDSTISTDLYLIAIFILFPLICGAAIGSLVFLVYSGVIEAWKLIQLFVASFSLNIGFLEICSNFITIGNSLYGQIIFIIVPIIIVIVKYFLNKSPQWIEKSASNIIIWFLTSLGITFLQFLFPFLLQF